MRHPGWLDDARKGSISGVSSPLVSVITPAHNVAPWIGEAMDSVLAQSESRFGYLVVDDHSGDGTADIVRERAAGDGRVRLLGLARASRRPAAPTAWARTRSPGWKRVTALLTSTTSPAMSEPMTKGYVIQG